MAIYEYLCPKCRKEFELMRPMSEGDRPARCPKCGSRSLKLISGFASKTGDSIQSPLKPFRKKMAVKAPQGRAKSKGTKTAPTRSKKQSRRK
jgi:putative FmdB family regulatory protein